MYQALKIPYIFLTYRFDESRYDYYPFIRSYFRPTIKSDRLSKCRPLIYICGANGNVTVHSLIKLHVTAFSHNLNPQLSPHRSVNNQNTILRFKSNVPRCKHILYLKTCGKVKISHTLGVKCHNLLDYGIPLQISILLCRLNLKIRRSKMCFYSYNIQNSRVRFLPFALLTPFLFFSYTIAFFT